MGTGSRSEAWHEVWDRRDPARVEYDGLEDAVANDEEVERLRSAEAAVAARLLRLDKQDHLLDLGCGTGAVTAKLATQVARVTAVDYSTDAVALARRRFTSADANVEVVQADLARFDYDSVECTKAVAIGSFHYLDGYEVLVAIVRKVTAKGAPMLLMDLPDSAFRDQIRRKYDQTKWSHLYVDIDQLRQDFPGMSLHRGNFPWYENDAYRFSALIPGESPSAA